MARKGQTRKQSLEQLVVLLTERYQGRLIPPWEGLAYRFTIFLPILSVGRPVFTDQQQILLYRLFHLCCGGYSQTSVQGFPPWHGSWLPEGGRAPIIDHHILLVVYSLQDALAETFFQQLKWVLQQEHIAGQQVVLIEQVPVRLIEAMEVT